MIVIAVQGSVPWAQLPASVILEVLEGQVEFIVVPPPKGDPHVAEQLQRGLSEAQTEFIAKVKAAFDAVVKAHPGVTFGVQRL